MVGDGMLPLAMGVESVLHYGNHRAGGKRMIQPEPIAAGIPCELGDIGIMMPQHIHPPQIQQRLHILSTLESDSISGQTGVHITHYHPFTAQA